MIANHRADEIPYRAFGIKMAQMNATGADAMVTSCSNCRHSLDDGQAHFGWDRKMDSLLELVADHLAEPKRAGAPVRPLGAPRDPATGQEGLDTPEQHIRHS